MRYYRTGEANSLLNYSIVHLSIYIILYYLSDRCTARQGLQ